MAQGLTPQEQRIVQDFLKISAPAEKCKFFHAPENQVLHRIFVAANFPKPDETKTPQPTE